MSTVNSFVLFGQAHVVTLLVILAIAVGLAWLARRAFSPAWQYRVAVLIGILLISHEAFSVWLYGTQYGRDWTELLPLHLCGLAIFFTAWVLIARSYLAYELVYFWAWGGTLQALLTPDLAVGFPHLGYIVFFFGHGMVIVGVLYATVVYGFRPWLRSIFKSVGALLVLAAIIGPINLWLDTNYMFLSAKPSGASLMDYMGPWPWYILSLVAVGILSCFIYYLPFVAIDWVKGRRSRDRAEV